MFWSCVQAAQNLIMNLIQRFLASQSQASSTIPDYVLEADDPNYWTEADAKTLSGFFRSDAGRKLSGILSNHVLRSAVAATNQESNLKYHCGKANGVRTTVELIQAHFTKVPPQAAENPVPDEENQFLAQYGVEQA